MLSEWLGTAAAVAGAIFTVVVAPAAGLYRGLSRRISALEQSTATMQTDQKWILQSVTKVETTAAATREEVASMSGKLDTVVDMLTTKGKK